jgi:hypothetical protein
LLIVLLRLLRYIDARNRRKLLLEGSGGGSLVVVDREIPKAA